MDLILFCKSTLFRLGVMEILKNIESVNSIDLLHDVRKLESTEDKIFVFVLDKYTKENINAIEILSKLKYSKLLVIDLDCSKRTIENINLLSIDGYLTSSSSKDDIACALKKIENNDKYFHSSITEVFINRESSIQKINNLSKRESEILKELASGCSNAEISYALRISENTVKKHVSNIFQKIHCKDRVQATIYAYDLGII